MTLPTIIRALYNLNTWWQSLFATSPPFQDIVSDPIFGRLEWEGYKNGDWWIGEIVIDNQVVRFLIGGTHCPDPTLVVRAHDLVGDYGGFRREIETFLQGEVIARDEYGDLDEEISAITQLSIAFIALFPIPPNSISNDGYVGEFVIFSRRDRPECPTDYTPSDYDGYYYRYADWRCDLVEGQPTNLRRWL